MLERASFLAGIQKLEIREVEKNAARTDRPLPTLPATSWRRCDELHRRRPLSGSHGKRHRRGNHRLRTNSDLTARRMLDSTV